MVETPHRNELMRPILEAVEALGGSAVVEEINNRVFEIMKLPVEAIEKPYISKKGNVDGRTQLEYDLAWARTYLKQLGLLKNSARGVWLLTPQGRLSLSKGDQPFKRSASSALDIPDTWRSELREILKERITPNAFERLIQRVLRETGFAMVEVTGRSGDGGIDGKGIARINGILSFHVVFQCKRYKGSIGASAIRDFRGAMQGKADKGLFITTGSFTREALKEATRDGAIAIDLVDGERLMDKLHELRLGINVEMLEQVSLQPEWFDEL